MVKNCGKMEQKVFLSFIILLPRALQEAVSTLKEKANILEQELEQQREQHRIRVWKTQPLPGNYLLKTFLLLQESNLEEEMGVLRAQLLDGQRASAAENVQLIQLHKDCNLKEAQLKTVRAQLEGLEEQVTKLRIDCERAQADARYDNYQMCDFDFGEFN